MDRRRFDRRTGLRPLLVGVVAALAAVLFSDAADAQTYTVSSCNNGVNHAWSPYSNSGVSNLTMGTSCPGAYSAQSPTALYNSGIFVRNVQNSNYTPSGAYAGVKLTAPAGNTIASISGDWWVTRTNGSGFYSALMSDWSVLSGCYAGPDVCGAILKDQSIPVNGASTLRVELGCSNPAPGCYANNANQAIFELYRADVVINDLTTPSVSPSGSLWSGNWLSGARSVTVSGTDAADGIQRNDLNIDGRNVASQGHGCDFSYLTPCATTAGDTFTYDTHQLSDGPHSIQVAAWDAGWLGGSASTTIHVDNHAPDLSRTPVTVAQGEAWTPNNSFDLSWVNATGEVAPVTKAHYSVCQAASPDTCAVQDGQVSGNGVQTISGIKLPAAGDYVVRVWLEDAAGNVNAGLASVPVHLRYDPTVPGQAAPVHRNGWVNAEEAKAYPQEIQFPQSELKGPSGIAGYAVTTDASDPGSTINFPGANATYPLNELPEGITTVKARAISGAGVAADKVGSTAVQVDKTAPLTSVGGAPDPAEWQRHAVTLELVASDQAGLSGMRGATPDDPDVTHGGYLEYRVDALAAERRRGENVDGIPTETSALVVSTDGQHILTYKAVDFAGNESPEKTVELKIDQTAPDLVAFEAQDPAHPTTLSVAVADRTSGVAGGAIEMRRQGASNWISLPTRLDGNHLVATVDDSKLPAVAYEFQARARDRAGNETVSNRRRDGGTEVLIAPFRIHTRMTAGIVRVKPSKAKKISATCRRSKKCMANVRRQQRKAKKKAQKLPAGTVSTLTVPYGKSARIRGMLATSDRRPIARQAVAVYRRLDAVGQRFVRIGTVRTDHTGQFTYRAPKGASRVVRFQFDGTETLYPAAAQVKMLVRATSTLKASKRTVLNGQSVRFSGKIGLPVVNGLKVVDLQAFYRHKWRTFAAPRVSRTGAWKFTYRFEATSGLVTYKFRTRVPREAGYPYQLGYSKVVAVTVRGR